MPKFTITQMFRFEAAHRLLNHKGKCRYLHGHSYYALVTVSREHLNEAGMVVDFSVLKNTIGKWIDEHLDHTTILNKNDPLNYKGVPNSYDHTFGRYPFCMPSDEDPTAENIAKLLYNMTVTQMKIIDPLLTVESVMVRETENCFATHGDKNASA